MFSLFLALPASGQMTPQQAILRMTRGINLGRCLEMAREGDAQTIQEFYFDDITNAGFNFVRIPIQWDQHTGTAAPYSVDSAWLNRVQQVVDWGMKRGLIVIINSHHDSWMLENPNYTTDDLARFQAIWTQVSDRLRTNSANLLFEIANEPIPLSVAQVNQINAAIIPVIRTKNPTRIIVFSGNGYTSVDQMKSAARPNDPYLMAEFHSYDPWDFAGKGIGTWGTAADKQEVTNRFNAAAAWSQQYNIPVILGEWGTVGSCDAASRQSFIATYAQQASRTGIAPCLWHDFGWFGIYYPNNPPANRWSNVKDIIMANTLPAPSGPIVISDIGIETNNLNLSWTSIPGDVYRLEYSLDLITWGDLIHEISAAPGTNTTVATKMSETTTDPNAVLAQYQMGMAAAHFQNAGDLVAAGPLTAGIGATLFNPDATVTPAYGSQPELQVGFSGSNPDLATALVNHAWFTFSITVGTNVSDLDLSQLSFNTARGGAAEPRGFAVFASTPTTANQLLQGATDILEQRPTWESRKIDLTGINSLQDLTNGQVVTFTIPIYAPAPGNSVEFDDITLLGKSTYRSVLARLGATQVFFRIRKW